jgi:phosphatidylethanolamine-binding protein (PEBP) family uncharacterized protein
MRFLLSVGFVFLMLTPAKAMNVSFEWGQTKSCFDSKSPPMTLNAVPKETKKLRIKMVDRNVPSYPHGGGKVDYTGQKKLEYGAFKYTGPCPPEPHIYEFTVEALDSAGKVLALAKAKRKFPE